MAVHENFKLANQRARDLQASIPRVVSAHYNRKSGHIVIHLSSKLILSFSPHDAQGLRNARPSQLDAIEISPSGFGIHFPKLDADIYIPGLLEGFLGSKKWMAARLGPMGGQSRRAVARGPSSAKRSLAGPPREATRLLRG